MGKAIEVENLSKAYQIGEFTTGTLSNDLERWWALARGKEDPFLKIGETNVRSSKGESNVVWSLKDLNFVVEQGEAIGILGKNGAGKSTLLKILSKVTTPTRGLVKMKGRVASLLEVGTGFHPDLTGRENIYLNGAILGMQKSEVRRKFDEIVDFSGVERYIDTPVKRYSSGMYVRLAFAVAAHLESEILIVDEVLAVGDVEFQKKCLGKMSDVVGKEGKTILFVSHIIESIRNICPKTMVLEDGRIGITAKTEDAIEYYFNSFNKENLKNYVSYPKSGNDSITVDCVRIINDSYNEITNLYISRKHYVEIIFTVLNPSRFQASLIVQTITGIELFASLNNHDKYYNRILKKGQYRSIIEIPPNIFNSISYTISIATFGSSNNFILEHVLTFTGIDDGKLRSDFEGNFGGILRPKLKWVTKEDK